MLLKVVILLVMLVIHSRLGDALLTEAEAFDMTCITDNDCGNVMMTCQDVNVTDTVEKRCACDQSQQFYRHPTKDTCRLHAHLTERCSDTDSSVCVDSGAICLHAGDLDNTWRCECSLNDIMVMHEGTRKCARPLTGRIDPLCETCEQQLGRCYDVDGDNRRDGCQCPVSLTGDDCEIVHVFVSCTVEDFKMTVCYDPHDGVDFTAGARMHTEDHGTDPACLGFPDEESLCEYGTHRLELPLAEGEREKCGTYKTFSQSSIKYENRIFVDKGTDDPNDYLMFKTYCAFQTHATASFTGMGVFPRAEGWAGEESTPHIELSIERSLGDQLTVDTPIRLGDGVRFHLRLNPDGDYGAVRVESCVLSSSHTSHDYRAQTLRMLTDGCPTANDYLHSSNKWHAVQEDRPYDVITGIVYPPMMRTGGATYLHCTVKLCLRGEIDRCEPKTCTPGGNGRRRRGVHSRHRRDMPDLSDKSSYQELSKGIHFQNDDTPTSDTKTQYQTQGKQDDVISMGRVEFAVSVTILLLLLLIFMVSTFVLATRELQRMRSKVASQGVSRPPVFHLPRNT